MEVKINLNQEQAAALLDFLRGMPLSSNTTLEIGVREACVALRDVVEPVGVKSRNPADR